MSSSGGNTIKRRSSQQNAKQKAVKTAVLYTPSSGLALGNPPFWRVAVTRSTPRAPPTLLKMNYVDMMINCNDGGGVKRAKFRSRRADSAVFA